jgi:hypothetical protein
MSDTSNPQDVEVRLKRLVSEFFSAVSFETGQLPSYERLHELFVDGGLLIKNSGASPEVSSVRQFIAPRQASVAAGELMRFHEIETSARTEIFGNVAHRFIAYAKSGTLNGVPFSGRGMISAQFVLTPVGWKFSAMAWDDERNGLGLDQHWHSS